jgi:hypothetical protein
MWSSVFAEIKGYISTRVVRMFRRKVSPTISYFWPDAQNIAESKTEYASERGIVPFVDRVLRCRYISAPHYRHLLPLQ